VICQLSAVVPRIPLIIPGETEQSEQTAAQLRFLVPVANDHYGCPQHILNEKRQLFLQLALLGDKFLYMKLAGNSKLYSSSHDACKVFDNNVKIVGRRYFILS